MKKILFIISLFICFFANAQEPANVPSSKTYWYQGDYIQGLKGVIIGLRDTAWTPRYAGTKVFWQHAGVDSAFWGWDGFKWNKEGSGNGGSGTLAGLSDVDTSGEQSNYVLIYNGTNYSFVPQGVSPAATITWSVLAISSSAPVSPTAGDKYLVSTPGTGFSPATVNQIAEYSGSAWVGSTAAIGDLLYDNATDITYKYTGSAWVALGKLDIHQGLDAYGVTIKIGSSDAQQVRLMYNGANRIVLGGTNGVTFSQLTGASTGIMGLSTAGVASNVQIGSGLQLLAGVLSSAASGSPLFPLTGTGTATGNVTGDLGGFSLSVTNAARMTISLSDSMLIGANKFSVAALDSANIRANVFYSGAIRTTVGATTYALVGLLDSSAAIRFQNGLMYMKGTTTGTGSIARIDASTKALGYSSTISLTSEVANTLPVGNGGTGVATIPTGGIMLGAGTSPITTLVGTVVNQVPVWNGTTWAAGTVTNYWARTQYGALASTNILQPATLTDTTVIGSGLAALNGLFNVQGRSYFVGNVGINTAPTSATYELNVSGDIQASGGGVRIDGGLTVGSGTTPATSGGSTAYIGNGLNGNSITGLELNVNLSGNTRTAQIITLSTGHTTTSGTTTIGINNIVSNTTDASTTQTAGLYQNFYGLIQTKSNSATPVLVANNFAAELGNTNSRTQTYTTGINFWAKPISNTALQITSGGNLYEFLADSSLAATFTGASAWGFYQRANTANNIKNVFQGNTLIGSGTQNASAALEVISTTQGILFPRMTTTQRDAISSPAAGLVIYNTTTNKLNVYTTAWEAITSL